MNELGIVLKLQLLKFGLPYRAFLNVVQSNGASICGGFPLGLATGNVFEDSDIDIFQFRSENVNIDEHIYSIVAAFYSWKYRLDRSKTPYPYRMLSFFKMIGDNKKIVQWVFKTPSNLSHPIDDFDISVCCTTIEFPDGIKQPILRSLYPNDVQNKYVKINALSMIGTNVATVESKMRTARRIVKYMKRGYVCDPSSPSSLDDLLNLISEVMDTDESTDIDYFPATDLCITPPQSSRQLPDCPERPTKTISFEERNKYRCK